MKMRRQIDEARELRCKTATNRDEKQRKKGR